MNETTNNPGTQWIKLERDGSFIRTNTVLAFKPFNGFLSIQAVLPEGQSALLYNNLDGLDAMHKEAMLEELVRVVAEGVTGLLDCAKLHRRYRVRYALSQYKLIDVLDKETREAIAKNATQEQIASLDVMTLAYFCCNLDILDFSKTYLTGRGMAEAELRSLLYDVPEKLINPKGLFPFETSIKMFTRNSDYAYFTTL